MKKVAIVIPIYKQKLSKFEEISLKQAIRVFNNYRSEERRVGKECL